MRDEQLRVLARRLARQCRRVIQSRLLESEWRDADEQFARIIFEGLNRIDRGESDAATQSNC